MSDGWIDSHCHLQERYLPGDSDATVSDALARARAAGVEALVCVGTDATTSRQAAALAAAGEAGVFADAPRLRSVVGLHPHDADSSLDWLVPLLDEGYAGLVGVGECGLDYHYDHAPRDAQQRRFAEQIGVAHERELALIIHARDAWDDLFAVLDAEGVPPRTVLHCFTGGPQEAAGCVERGLTVSFSGVITFKNAGDVREAAAVVPLDALLVETDSPFLAPVPHRGQPNEPALVPLVGAAVAAAKGLDAAEVAVASSATARRIFQL